MLGVPSESFCLLTSSACLFGGPRRLLGLTSVQGMSRVLQGRHGGPSVSHCECQCLKIRGVNDQYLDLARAARIARSAHSDSLLRLFSFCSIWSWRSYRRRWALLKLLDLLDLLLLLLLLSAVVIRPLHLLIHVGILEHLRRLVVVVALRLDGQAMVLMRGEVVAGVSIVLFMLNRRLEVWRRVGMRMRNVRIGMMRVRTAMLWVGSHGDLLGVKYASAVGQIVGKLWC